MDESTAGGPKVKVQCTIDRLEATLLLEPSLSPEGPRLDRQYLREQLHDNGVVCGLDDEALQELVERYNQGDVPLEAVTVARGDVPSAGTLGTPHPEVAMVLSHEVIAGIRQAPPEHYHDYLAGGGDANADRVDPGQILFSFPGQEPGKPGVAVDGSEIEPCGEVEMPLALGPGVEYDPKATAVLAQQPGVLLFDGQTVEVLPLEFDAAVEVLVSADGMEAHLTLTPPGPGGADVTGQSLHDELARAGVKMGLLGGVVEQISAAIPKDQGRLRRQVARGREGVDGTDAWLEYLVDLELEVVPIEEQRGRVDFRSVSVITSVDANQELVRRHPGVKGTPGFTVGGKIVAAYSGREVKLPRGRNVEPDPDDPNLLRAKVAGNVRASGGAIEVSECFAVKGDVDYSTGHIDFARSVTVSGDVKAGFNVEVGGDLEISGSVEDCQLTVGGNVLIRRGFVGQGHGVLQAKGDALIGFARNQTIRSLGALTIEREAINVNASSRSQVTVNGSLVGGTVAAKERIQCKIAGGNTGTRTELVAGVDYLLQEQREQLEQQLTALRRRRAALAAGRDPDAAGPGSKAGSSATAAPSPETQGPGTVAEADSLLALLEERHKLLLEQAYSFERPTVVVTDRVHPGVLIRIGHAAALKVGEEMSGPVTFVVKDGAVARL